MEAATQQPAKSQEEIDADYKRRVERRVTAMQEKAELDAKVKRWKAEDKADGFDEKPLAHAAKCKFKGMIWYADQLEFELLVETSRKAAGLPTELEEARKLADAEKDALRRGDPAAYEKRYGSDEEREESVFDNSSFGGDDKPRRGKRYN